MFCVDEVKCVRVTVRIGDVFPVGWGGYCPSVVS